MAKTMIDFDVVREIALGLPGVEESAIHGAPSIKLRGKLLTCPALHSSAEPNSLMVRIDFDRRVELMKVEPDVYYVTNHYVNYPSMLVRLSRIDRTALKDLAGLCLALRELEDEGEQAKSPWRAAGDTRVES